MKNYWLNLADCTDEGKSFLRNAMNTGQTLKSEKINLVHKWENPINTNAVEVWYRNNSEKIRLGFIQKEQEPEVVDCLDDIGFAEVIDNVIYRKSSADCGLHLRTKLFYPSDVELPDYDLDIPDDCDWPVYNYQPSCCEMHELRLPPKNRIGVPF